MAGTNFKPAVRTSWATGLPTQPDKPCVKCKGKATGWVSYEYASGKKNRLATGHRPVCGGCAQGYCDEQNAKGDKTPARRGRRVASTKTPASAPVAAPAVPTLTDEERAIQEKHGVEVKPGSLKRDEQLGKKTLVIFCKVCKRPRQIYSQDAFQVKTCGQPACKKEWKKINQ